ncbi:MAG: hypothetical protein NT091_00045, partial [Candidatus Falkowbacteria bacterium]|nr:hypothetical protein [Candidatus Falkowbacteria bacterium]
LHKLAGLVVKSDLPTYVTFAKSSTPNIGSLNFDAATNQVVWSIGDQNVSEIDGLAEFDVSVTPGEADKGKVMVLLKGTKIEAQDLETESKINNTIKAKTTKLSDDDIANSDGIVK